MLDRMKTTQTSAPRRRLAAIFLAAGLAAGCATNQGAVVGADPRASFGEVRPGPSADRVIGGIAEMVLTNRLWPSFEEARENPVAVVNDGKAEIRKVRQTRDLGNRVEVDAGVKAGDQVILNPSVDLANGTKVQPKPEASAPSK